MARAIWNETVLAEAVLSNYWKVMSIFLQIPYSGVI
jgi:hypothetical protein